jgi:hypothetical protein
VCTRAKATPAFKAEYAARAGIDGTLSHAVRAVELRQARSRGLAKTHLPHGATAAAINLVRRSAWLQATTARPNPPRPSRCSGRSTGIHPR